VTKERSIPLTNLPENNSSLPQNNNKTIIFLKQFLLFSASGITLTIFIILVSVLRGGYGVYGTMKSFLNFGVSQPKVEIQTVVIDKIKLTSELTTATFVMEAVVPASEDRKLGDLVIASTKLLYIARGEVKAGVDLSKIKAKDIKFINNNSIEISLPAPQIIDSKIDVDRSFVYDYDRGFLNLGPDAAIDLQTSAQRKTLDKIIKSACQKNILEEANQKAKLTVSSLLNTAGYAKVKVITSSPDKSSCS